MKTLILQPSEFTTSKIERVSLIQLVDKKDQLEAIIAEATKLNDEIKAELLIRVEDEQVKTKNPAAILYAGDRTIQAVPVRLYSSVSVEWADEHAATKIVVDSKKLSILFDEGVTIPGIKTTERVLVSKLKEDK